MTARQVADIATDYDHMGSVAWTWIFVNRSEGASTIRMMWLADWTFVWKEIREVNSGFRRASRCIWWTCCWSFAENSVREQFSTMMRLMTQLR